jgi:hypothetical protein
MSTFTSVLGTVGRGRIDTPNLEFAVERIPAAEFEKPRPSEALATDPFGNAGVIVSITPMAERPWDLGAQAPLDAAATASHGLSLGEEPGAPLTGAVNYAVRVDVPKMDSAGAFAVTDRAIPALFSTFHDDLLAVPVRHSAVVTPVRGIARKVEEFSMG